MAHRLCCQELTAFECQVWQCELVRSCSHVCWFTFLSSWELSPRSLRSLRVHGHLNGFPAFTSPLLKNIVKWDDWLTDPDAMNLIARLGYFRLHWMLIKTPGRVDLRWGVKMGERILELSLVDSSLVTGWAAVWHTNGSSSSRWFYY